MVHGHRVVPTNPNTPIIMFILNTHSITTLYHSHDDNSSPIFECKYIINIVKSLRHLQILMNALRIRIVVLSIAQTPMVAISALVVHVIVYQVMAFPVAVSVHNIKLSLLNLPLPCIDIDVCSEVDTCDHVCIVTPTSRFNCSTSCSCRSGYRLDLNGYSCNGTT